MYLSHMRASAAARAACLLTYANSAAEALTTSAVLKAVCPNRFDVALFCDVGFFLGAAGFALGIAVFAFGAAGFFLGAAGFALGMVVFAFGAAGFFLGAAGLALGMAVFAFGATGFCMGVTGFALGMTVFAFGATCFCLVVAGFALGMAVFAFGTVGLVLAVGRPELCLPFGTSDAVGCFGGAVGLALDTAPMEAGFALGVVLRPLDWAAVVLALAAV